MHRLVMVTAYNQRFEYQTLVPVQNGKYHIQMDKGLRLRG